MNIYQTLRSDQLNYIVRVNCHVRALIYTPVFIMNNITIMAWMMHEFNSSHRKYWDVGIHFEISKAVIIPRRMDFILSYRYIYKIDFGSLLHGVVISIDYFGQLIHIVEANNCGFYILFPYPTPRRLNIGFCIQFMVLDHLFVYIC